MPLQLSSGSKEAVEMPNKLEIRQTRWYLSSGKGEKTNARGWHRTCGSYCPHNPVTKGGLHG